MLVLTGNLCKRFGGRSMSVRIFYVDESYDASKFCISAIAIRHSEWQECFREVKNHRAQLKQQHGIQTSKEIHAREFVAGRGFHDLKELTKWKRSRIYLGLLQLVARLPKVLIFNVCLDVKAHADPHLTAWERLVNRIERTLLEFEVRESKDRGKWLSNLRTALSAADFESVNRRLSDYYPKAMIVSDEGKEQAITRSLRRMHVFNPIPSKYGAWQTGQKTRNITTERIIDDPFFRQSQSSYFVQLADCVAYALLKREVIPTPNIAKYGIDRMFEDALSSVCFRDASPRDPLGIVR